MVDLLRRVVRKRGRQGVDVTQFSDLEPSGETADTGGSGGLREFADVSYVGMGLGAADVEVQVQIIDLRIALERLPGRQREIVRLSALYGFSPGEIGKQLHPPLSGSRVKQLLREARATICGLTGRPFDL